MHKLLQKDETVSAEAKETAQVLSTPAEDPLKLPLDAKKLPLDKAERRNTLLFMAKVAEAAERFDDMCACIRAVVLEPTGTLTQEDATLVNIAYKNRIGRLRHAYKTIEEDRKSPLYVSAYKAHVGLELKSVCLEALDLLENTLLTNESLTPQLRILFLKMVGDCCKFLVEVSRSRDHERKANQSYENALETARKALGVNDALRLMVVLNYSVFLYEVENDKEKAMRLAKDAFDKAIPRLEDLNEGPYKDSTLIMQLLRDNLSLWNRNASRR